MNELEKLRMEAIIGNSPSLWQKIKFYTTINKNRYINKLKETAAIITGKKYATSKNYQGVPKESQEIVEQNPEKYIIKECIDACKILWSKNIFTFMCSDQVDKNAWIELELVNLSAENKAILEEIKKHYTCYQYHPGCINIQVKGMGHKARLELIKIAEIFQMQDVPEKESTISINNILINSGCTKKIKNPNFIPFNEIINNLKSQNWQDLPIEDEYITVLDETKISKPIEEYIKDYGAIIDEASEKIYTSNFYYQKHLNYLKYLEKKQNKSLN